MIARDLGAGPDLAAGRPGGGGERRRQRAGPAPGEDGLARGAAVVAGRVGEEDAAVPAGPRARRAL